MPDDTGAAAGATATTDTSAAATGAADASKTNTDTSTTQTFDPAKVSDADFAKIFDDPRVFQHSRFKELNDKAKKAQEYEVEKQKATEAKLAEEGKFKELLAEKEKQIEKLTKTQQTFSLNQKILLEAQKVGVVDPEVVLQLIDRSSLTMDDNGIVTGADEAVKKLLEAKPYLKGTGATTTSLGGATNPGGNDAAGVKRFKHSQLQDTKFYAEHEAEIMASMKAGMIEDDM